MIDVLYDSTGDIACVGGDLVLGDSTNQHIEDLVYGSKGWYHFDPFICMGLMEYINDDLVEYELIRMVRLELELDGLRTTALSTSAEVIIHVEGNYVKQNRIIKPYSDGNIIGAILKKHVVLKKQSIYDIAVMYYLNLDGVYRIALLNNIDPFVDLKEGQILLVDNYSLDPYNGYSAKLSSLVTNTENTAGIAYWAIEDNFKIQ